MVSREAERRAEDFRSRVIEFCRLLRDSGLKVTPSETIDVTRGVALTDLGDHSQFYNTLRTCLVKRQEDYAPFDRAFSLFWRGSRKRAEGQVSKSRTASDESRRTLHLQIRGVNFASADYDSRVTQPNPSDSGEAGSKLYAIYSPLERKGRKVFANLTLRDAPEIRRTLKRLERRLATRPGRRYISSRKGRPNFKKTMRSGIRMGEVVRVHRMVRSLTRTRLVILCDISGSMDSYSERLIKLLHLASNAIPSTRVFAFSTSVSELGTHLKGRSLPSAAEAVSRSVDIWSSGTRIGSALHTLLEDHASAFGRDSILAIISDGWEIGDVDLLRKRLQELRRRVNRIVWVNPLADEPNFTPSSAGMRAALPFIDHLVGLKPLMNRTDFEKVFATA